MPTSDRPPAERPPAGRPPAGRPSSDPAPSGPLGRRRAVRVRILGWDRLTRAGLRSLLSERSDLLVVGDADGPADVVVLGAGAWPDDLADQVLHVREAHPATGVLVIASALPTSVGELDAVLRAGASGVILADATVDVLAEALAAVADGGAVLSPRCAQMVLVEVRRRRIPLTPGDAGAVISRLSARQRAVLQLLVEGNRPSAIAEQLGLAPGTVRTHLGAIYRALHVTSAPSAVAWVHQQRVAEILRRVEASGQAST